MSKTSIPVKVINQLLVKSVGRCQYRGCNKSLYKDLVTKRNFNQSYIAHIVADEPGGPRGDAKRSKLLSKDLNNLMLLCDTHHRLVDKIDVAGHPEATLLEMKKEHEDRIELVTAIAPNMQSHILTYRANVGVHTREVCYQTVSQYLQPEYYPAEAETIDLSLSNSVERDKDTSFWSAEITNLEKQVEKYGFQEVRTPVFEHTELFLRGVGETTDIVQKEMYTFLDKGERSITLKPEGTAGVVRMFVENNLFGDTQPTKMFYLYSPTFRYERPQAGRLREHHQFGVEFFGASKPSADAECIAVATELLSSLGCGGLTVRLNSIGDPNCRPKYHEALKGYLHAHYDELCETCKLRLETNPLRVLDCKVESCQKIANGAPVISDYLCDDCRDHQNQLLKLLDGMGIRYVIDPRLVRGLDYYTKTVFEITSESIGSQSAVCGGGRYDGLVEEIGGPHTPAVGFGLGMERLLLVLENTGYQIEKPVRYDLYIASMGTEAEEKAFLLANNLRKLGSKVEIDHIGRSVKAQLKYADKIGASYVLVLGGDELEKGEAKLKRMSDGQETITALNAESIHKLMV